MRIPRTLGKGIRLIPFLLVPISTWAGPGVQVQTDFAQHYNFSQGTPSGGAGGRLIYRDLGFSTRWRLSFRLAERVGRPLELLVGPYVRFPFLFSFTNYGVVIESPGSTEPGFDLGLNWFHLLRTMLSFAPGWSISYKTSDIPGDDPSKRTEVTAKHWSIGVRTEIPLFMMESDPGDRRVEFGGLLAFQLDKIRSFRLSPENFSPGPTDSTAYGQEITGTQDLSFRWMLGAFMNFRL